LPFATQVYNTLPSLSAFRDRDTEGDAPDLAVDTPTPNPNPPVPAPEIPSGLSRADHPGGITALLAGRSSSAPVFGRPPPSSGFGFGVTGFGRPPMSSGSESSDVLPSDVGASPLPSSSSTSSWGGSFYQPHPGNGGGGGGGGGFLRMSGGAGTGTGTGGVPGASSFRFTPTPSSGLPSNPRPDSSGMVFRRC
jgi:hypothetical protein